MDDLRPIGPRVLVIDDDPTTRQRTVSSFEDQAFSATGMDGAEDLAGFLSASTVRLVVLDTQLHDRDGLDLLRRIRAQSDVPVIMITPARGDEIDRVVGLELGADDCLTKPVNPRELVARARAILRRHDTGHAGPTKSGTTGGYRFEGWELRRKTRTLRDPSGALVALTKGDYALLVAFLEAPRRLLSREDLLTMTRTHDDVFDRSIDVQVLRLRRKLETDPARPRLIRTERGMGYSFDASVEPLS